MHRPPVTNELRLPLGACALAAFAIALVGLRHGAARGQRRGRAVDHDGRRRRQRGGHRCCERDPGGERGHGSGCRRGAGRRGSSAAAGAGATASVRGSDQGREGDRGSLPVMAKGREGLDRDRARAVRRAVPLHGQLEPRRGRTGRLRRHDAVGPDRRVQAHRQHRAAHREELRVHRGQQRGDALRRQGRLHRQPAELDHRREPAAPRSQVDPDRRESRCCSTDIPVGERFTTGRPHAGATRSTRATRASRRCATRPTSRRSSCSRITRIRARRCRLRRRLGTSAEPVPAVHDAAGRAQPVPRLHYNIAKLPEPMRAAARRPARRAISTARSGISRPTPSTPHARTT